MSEVAISGGGGSQNFRHCLKFYAFLNLSLRERLKKKP